VRRAVAYIDVGAIERNVQRLRRGLSGGAKLCAVVKADGYGHGCIEAGRAAVRGGAAMLAVATADEAAAMRAALPEVPILTMGALSEQEIEIALGAGSEIALWREGFRARLAAGARALGVRPRVHVKYDSGMGRLGERDAEAVERLCAAVAADDALELAGLWTHFATADELENDYFERQLEAFTALAERVRAAHPEVMLHAANSAATLREPAAHFDMVRCGVAIYGMDPFGIDPRAHGLEPALELRSHVVDTKRLEAGASVGYGRTWIAPRDTVIGVLPIGYGDGWRRGLSNRAHVLIEGRRYPIVGTISMDNLTVDLGPDATVKAGTEAVLIGERNGVRQSAEEVARELATINYEVTCGLTARVPRVYVGGPHG